MPTNTKKTVPVKSLRKAIKDGMGYKEAAKHALAELKSKLNMCKDGGQNPNMEDVIKVMAETNDHSIKFQAKKNNGEPIYWCVEIASDVNNIFWLKNEAIFSFAVFNVRYYATERVCASRDAKEDAKTLNQFVLDFYGIERQEPTKKDARAKTRQIRSEITRNQKHIKSLQVELKKLAKII